MANSPGLSAVRSGSGVNCENGNQTTVNVDPVVKKRKLNVTDDSIEVPLAFDAPEAVFAVDHKDSMITTQTEYVDEDILRRYVVDEVGDLDFQRPFGLIDDQEFAEQRLSEIAMIKAMQHRILRELSDDEKSENNKSNSGSSGGKTCPDGGYMSDASTYSDLFCVDPQLVWSESKQFSGVKEESSAKQQSNGDRDNATPANDSGDEYVGGSYTNNKSLTKRYSRLKEDHWYPRLNSVRATVSAVLKKQAFTYEEAVSYTIKTLYHPTKPPKTQLNSEEMEIVRDRLVKWLERKFGLESAE